jgi:hypothetical protein
MSMLANLKLVTSKREQGTNPVLHRRNKLSVKLSDQILLAEAKRDGRTYAPTRLKTAMNKVTGERTTFESQKRIREWWYINSGGKINLIVKYGSKPIAFDTKGTKNAIEVNSGDELIAALKTIKAAVDAGELDQQIESASGAIRARFLK